MRVLIEDCPRIELAHLRQMPDWSTFKKQGRASIHIEVDGDGRDVEVELTTDEATFGVRHWLSCSSCGAKREHLYVGADRVACRECLGLIYYQHSWPRSRWRDEIGRSAFKASRRVRREAASCSV